MDKALDLDKIYDAEKRLRTIFDSISQKTTDLSGQDKSSQPSQQINYCDACQEKFNEIYFNSTLSVSEILVQNVDTLNIISEDNPASALIQLYWQINSVIEFAQKWYISEREIEFFNNWNFARKTYGESVGTAYLRNYHSEFRLLLLAFYSNLIAIADKTFNAFIDTIQSNSPHMICMHMALCIAILKQSEENTIIQLSNCAAKSAPNIANQIFNSLNNNSPTSRGCYIATCVYGSYDCPEVWILRRYRDNVLSKSKFGRWFIKTYYRYSPKLVAKQGENEKFKKFWRALLNRKIRILKMKGFEDTPYNDI